jgi:hypothetical protein
MPRHVVLVNRFSRGDQPRSRATQMLPSWFSGSAKTPLDVFESFSDGYELQRPTGSVTLELAAGIPRRIGAASAGGVAA